MWFECTNTTKYIYIITNWVPYERTFKAQRFTYGAQSGEWYVEFIWLASATTRLWISLVLVNNSLTQFATWLCTYLYINIASLNVYISKTDSNSKDWNIGADSVRIGTDFMMRTARFCNLKIDIKHYLLAESHISIQYSIYGYMKL